MRFVAIIIGTLAAAAVTACATTGSSRAIPSHWLDVPVAARPGGLSYDATGLLLFVPPQRVETAGVRLAKEAGGEKLVRGESDLTPSFPAIDSFDVSELRKEVVFSARRETNFDIGLVSVDGSRINWVPNDPADEIGVQWAPRGHKISFVIRKGSGDVVRTVHVPTAAQLTADFPNGRVSAVAWDPPAERYAVIAESIDSSPRVEGLKYDGSDRRILVAPSMRLDAAIEPHAGGFLVRPATLRYGDKLPLVIWRDEDPLRWSDARASLFRETRVALLITPTGDSSGVAAVPWIDMTRTFAVGATAASAVVIRGADDVAAGYYRVRGSTVEVSPAVVQSFAASYIASQLKGFTNNGRHR